MIRPLILYYLNVKPTHGYEIQKFLQISGIDSWTKIQSGSIYYALAKLEKEGCVKVLREEKKGARLRKIYAITDKGKQELQTQLRQELLTPVTPVGSDKFFLNSILDELPEEMITAALSQHLSDLRSQEAYWIKWRQIKAEKDDVPKAEKIAFDMTIDSLKYQILWHEELLDNIGEYITLGQETRRIIQSIDFSDVEEEDTASPARLVEIEKLRDEIVNDPDRAVENIDRLLERLKKK